MELLSGLFDALAAQPAVFAVVITVLGLLVGSFLNVVILRLPVMMEREWRKQCAELDGAAATETDEPLDLMRPASRCPQCGKAIRPWQNIPVISYLLLRGKCAGCGKSIGLRYPAVELLTGLAALAVGLRFGVSWETLAALGFSFALIALSGIDIDHKLLPDSITLPLVWLGLFLSLFHGSVDAQTLFIRPREAVIGAIVGYLSLWWVYQVFRLLTGKEGMGFGDFKLLAAIGAWLGWQMLPVTIFLAAIVGAAAGIGLMIFAGRGRETAIPFGPYLAAAGWIAMMWGTDIVDWYRQISGF